MMIIGCVEDKWTLDLHSVYFSKLNVAVHHSTWYADIVHQSVHESQFSIHFQSRAWQFQRI